MYIPICENCNLCVPSRVNINKFSLSKSNKRNLKINEDLKLIKASELINLERYNSFLEYCKKDIKRVKWGK